MSADDGSCDYRLDPQDPVTWGGDQGDRCYVDSRWSCPHEVHDTVVEGETERGLCLFHLPPGRKNNDEVVEALVQSLQAASRSDDPDVQRRKQQFVGGRFNNFDVGNTTLPIADAYPLDFRHAHFTNGATYELTFELLNEEDTTYEGAANFSESTLTGDVDLRGAMFGGGVLFWDVDSSGGLDVSGATIDGNLLLSQSSVAGKVNLSGARLESANFDVAVLGGTVLLDGVKVDDYLSFVRASLDDDVYLRRPEGLADGLRFSHASIGGMIFVEGRPHADIDVGNGVRFDHTTVNGDLVFRRVDVGGRFDVEEAYIGESVDFLQLTVAGDANFRDAAMDGGRFKGAIIPLADFRGADLSGADLSDADLRGANFEQAVLSRANLFATDLRGAALYAAVMGDVRINHRTRFGNYSVYDAPDSIDGPTAKVEADGADHLTKAVEQYRMLEQLAGDNTYPGLQSDFFVRRKDVHRAQYREAGTLKWLLASISRGVWLYADSWQRILLTSAATVAVFGLLYSVTGGIHVATKQPTHAFDLPQLLSVSVPHSVGIVLLSLYFSVVTFTTLGYGDIHPTNAATQTLAGIESLVGAALIAMLVYVFGRRATR